MASESQDSIENDDQKAKEEHIKQRLKDLGVSDDSERPKESFLTKYGKYIVAVIFVALVAAYWFEYKKQVGTDEEQVADTTTNTNTMSQQVPGYGQPMMQPPAWVQERRAQMPQPPEPPAWVQERRAQMPQPPEPPAWVKERRTAWMQTSPMYMQNAPGASTDSNTVNTPNNQPHAYPYANNYPGYPPPYWQNYGYYPNGVYGQWPAYPGPYYGW